MPINYDKQKIKRSFNRAHQTYDIYCDIQKQIARLALSCLANWQYPCDVIVDMACGTGESTLMLAKQVTHKKCYGLDFSPALLALARQKTPVKQNTSIDWVCSDVEERYFASQTVDLIFCNMGLQWVRNLAQVFALFYDYLKPSKTLLFSMPLAGNFPEIKPAFSLPLLTNQAVQAALLSASFDILEYKYITHRQSFSSAWLALKSLKSIGANCHATSLASKRKGLSKTYLDSVFINPNEINLTYQVGIYLARTTSRA